MYRPLLSWDGYKWRLAARRAPSLFAFTKPLPRQRFEQLRSGLGLVMLPNKYHHLQE
jgi:hypothetical protein